MTWPTVPIVTTSMDAGTDTPPRDQIKAMADAINEMIATPPAAGAGRLIGVQIFTTVGSSTYTPTPGTGSVVVEVQGGGGAGGGTPATSASEVAAGQGGGAGAYAIARVTSGFSGVSVTVGAGGAASSGASGGTGGSSSFGSFVACSGGMGGMSGAATATSSKSVSCANIGSIPVVSGTGGVFIIMKIGARGEPGLVIDVASGMFMSGCGAETKFGPGGASSIGYLDASGATAVQITSYGAGGAGALSNTSTGSPQGSTSGGRGGIVIVWEYA